MYIIFNIVQRGCPNPYLPLMPLYRGNHSFPFISSFLNLKKDIGNLENTEQGYI